MRVQDRAPSSGPSRSPRFWVLLLLLVLPGSAPASEGQQEEPAPGSKATERPAWLRPLEAETNPGTEPTAGPAEEDGGWPGAEWSELEPGVLDVQAWDWLQQDLERMLDRTRVHSTDRLSPEAFEEKYLAATAAFLELDAETAKAFQRAVREALDEIEGARADVLRRRAEIEPGLDETAALLASRADWEAYGKAQRDAVRHPLAVLEARPRHQLLREEMLKWLLRLDYGTGAAAR